MTEDTPATGPAQTAPPSTTPDPLEPSETVPTPERVTGGAVGGTEPVLGLREAADRATVSLSTLRRKKAELIEAGAVVTETGWQIPISALVRLGLMDRVTGGAPHTPGTDTPSDSPANASATVAEPAEVEHLRERLAQTERRAVEAEQRAAVAEAVAAERDRIIEAKDQALRMIEARPMPAPPPAGPSGPPPTSSPETQTRRRNSFFRRN